MSEHDLGQAIAVVTAKRKRDPGQSAALARATNTAELVERLADETTRRLRAVT